MTVLYFIEFVDILLLNTAIDIVFIMLLIIKRKVMEISKLFFVI